MIREENESLEIKSVAMIGAGAIGGYFIWGMSKALGDRFCVVADGARAERLARTGLIINGRHFDLNVKTPEEAQGVDLVLVATKYDGLRTAIPEIRTILGAGITSTTVMSLLNGIDSEEILAEEIGWSPIVNAYMVIASQRHGDRVYFNPAVTKGLVFGERTTPEKTERCAAIERLFETGDVRATWVPNIVQRQWAKFSRNIAYNIPQAILGVGIGAFSDSSHVLQISKRLEQEVITVGAAHGIDVPAIDRSLDERFDKRVRYSTLQDLDAGRHTEIDMFCGVLMKKAAEANLSVPAAELCYHFIKALEERQDGLFDYY